MKEPLEFLVHAVSLEGVAENWTISVEVVVKVEEAKAREVSDEHLRQGEVVAGQAGRIAHIEMESLQAGHLGQLLQVSHGVSGDLSSLRKMEMEWETPVGIIQIQRRDGEMFELGVYVWQNIEDVHLPGAAVEYT